MLGFTPLSVISGKAVQSGDAAPRAALISATFTNGAATSIKYVHSFGKDTHPTVKFNHFFFLYGVTSTDGAGPHCGYLQVSLGDGKGNLTVDFGRKVVTVSSSTSDTTVSFAHDIVLTDLPASEIRLGVCLYAPGSEIMLRP